MIKTNTPEYASLQNMVKVYAKVLCDSILPKASGKKSIVIDLTDERTAALSYRSFKYLGDTMQIQFARMFKKYVEPHGLKGDALDEYRLTDTKKFISFFSNPFTIGMISDYIEENYKDCKFKVKFGKNADQSYDSIIKAYKFFKTNNVSITWCDTDLVGLNDLIASLENPEDINNYWICRNFDGKGPAMFVKNNFYKENNESDWDKSKEANYVKTLYAAYTGTPYIGAVPCKYAYWEAHPEFRFCTKSKGEK